MSDKVEVDADGYETLYRKYHLALRLLREERERSERLRWTLEDFAEADCAYGDGCPVFGSRHGQCVGCIARGALEEAGK